jgi:hypothetical protein
MIRGFPHPLDKFSILYICWNFEVDHKILRKIAVFRRDLNKANFEKLSQMHGGGNYHLTVVQDFELSYQPVAAVHNDILSHHKLMKSG